MALELLFTPRMKNVWRAFLSGILPVVLLSGCLSGGAVHSGHSGAKDAALPSAGAGAVFAAGISVQSDSEGMSEASDRLTSSFLSKKAPAFTLPDGSTMPAREHKVSLWRSILAAVFVIGVLLALNLYLRRRNPVFSGLRSKHQIQVVDRHVVDHRRSLVLLEVEGRRILVGMGPERMESIDAWDAEAGCSFDAALHDGVEDVKRDAVE